MQLFLSIAFYIGIAALVIVLGLGIANLARTDENQASRWTSGIRASRPMARWTK